MNELIKGVKERRSIRRFDSRPIEEEKLTDILEAARWAPSWANSQCWEIVIVQNPDLRAQISKLLSPRNPASLAVANGPITLAICAETKKSGFYKGEQSTMLGDWLMYDLGLLTQTICLAAHSLGLGTVIVGYFDHLQVKSLLQIPDGFEIVALVPMGYPDHAPSPPKRREIRDFTHLDRFGNRRL